MLVLDSSAFFSMDALPQEDHVCPPGVIRELEKYEDPRLALWGDMVRVSDCSQESMRKVEEAAKKSGDLGRLSPVDMTVLALALDVDGTILSDDYSIQNVARIMGIGFRPVGMKGIEKVVKWNYKCIGCGKWYKEKYPECPVCGSAMKARRRKRSGEQMLASDQLAHPALSEYGHAHPGRGIVVEREDVGELLVVGRDLQRLRHNVPPLSLVVLQ
jgi:UPF0271 protein